MEKFQLIMISAMYENGGNTTHRMFDGHPNLCVYPFESQVGTGAVADFLSSFVPIRYRWPAFSSDVTPEKAYEMFWDEELKTLLRVPKRSKFHSCGLEMDENKRKSAFVKLMEGKLPTRANFVEAFFRSTFEAWGNYNVSGSESHYLGYNPVQVFDTDKIFRDFPESHMIHVIRNPFSGYADTIKRPFPLSVERYCWTWNLCQHMALTYKDKYPTRFHILYFEDMIEDPNKAIGKILNEMDLPMSDACLKPSFNKEVLKEVFPWGTIRIPTTEANLATGNELSQEQKEAVHTETAVMLRNCNYTKLVQQIM